MVGFNDDEDYVSSNARKAKSAIKRALDICKQMKQGQYEINERPATELLYEALRNACHTGSGFKMDIRQAKCTKRFPRSGDAGLINCIQTLLVKLPYSTGTQLLVIRADLRCYSVELWERHEARQANKPAPATV